MLVAIAALAAATAPKPHPAPKPTATLAPADRYFGEQKISALGIRNKTDALALRYHERTITDTDLVHDAKIVESAAYDWQRQFPRDPWIPRTMYRLEQLFQGVQSTNARSHATALATFLTKTYPATSEAHLLRLRLAQGFPPLQAESETHATPNPYAHDAGASPAASAPPSPAAGPAETPSASAPTPQPSSPQPPASATPAPQKT